MYSARTQWEGSPNALTVAWERRRVSGGPASDLTESNPTRCGFPYPAAAIGRALADPRALLYEPTAAGLPTARRAVAETLKADPDEFILCASTSEAYGWLLKLLCDPGDRILVPRPSYPLLHYLAGLEDVAMDGYPLRYDGHWSIDLEALEAAVGPRTRAVFVIHPNNPTGNFVTRGEAESLGRICAARGLAVVSDEVFLDYPFANPPSPPAAAAGSLAPILPCLAFSLGGLSKAAGLPQMKVGWIRMGGPEEAVRQAHARLEIIADTYLSVGTPAQWALPALLEAGRTVREEIRARTRANRRWLGARAHAASPWDLLRAEGGWYAVLRVPSVRSEEEWCLRMVETEGVLLHPGYFFDFEREAYLVASLLPSVPVFREAMGRVLSRLEREA